MHAKGGGAFVGQLFELPEELGFRRRQRCKTGPERFAKETVLGSGYVAGGWSMQRRHARDGSLTWFVGWVHGALPSCLATAGIMPAGQRAQAAFELRRVGAENGASSGYGGAMGRSGMLVVALQRLSDVLTRAPMNRAGAAAKQWLAAAPAAVLRSHADLALGHHGGRVVEQADGQGEQVVAAHADDEAWTWVGWEAGGRGAVVRRKGEGHTVGIGRLGRQQWPACSGDCTLVPRWGRQECCGPVRWAHPRRWCWRGHRSRWSRAGRPWRSAPCGNRGEKVGFLRQVWMLGDGRLSSPAEDELLGGGRLVPLARTFCPAGSEPQATRIAKRSPPRARNKLTGRRWG